MAGIAAAILGGAALLGGAGIGTSKMIKGNKKKKQGQLEGYRADIAEQIAEGANLSAQQQQQNEMEALAGQGMSEIANLQARYDERAQQGLPTELRDQYLENLQGSEAQALNSMSNRRGGLIGASNINQNAVQGYKDLLAMDAQQKLANEQQAMGFQGSAIGQMDSLRNRGLNFGIGNQQDNFQRQISGIYSDQDYAAALQGAGEQMVYSGAAGIVNSLGQASSFAAGGGFAGLGGGGGASAAAPPQDMGMTSSGGFGAQQGWGTKYQGTPKGFNAPLQTINPTIPSSVNTGLSYGSQQGFSPSLGGFGNYNLTK